MLYTYIKIMFSFQSEWFLDSLLTWQTQLNKELGAIKVVHTPVCFLSKAHKSTQVAYAPSSAALFHATSSYTYTDTGRAMSQPLCYGARTS